MGAILQAVMASIGSGYDQDAQAYFNAVETSGVTLNSTQKNAFNTFVVNTKSDGIWSKLYALYPFIGGTAASHAIDAKSLGTYNISWNGTITHSSTGSLSDGTTGYGIIPFNPSVNILDKTSSGLFVYSRTDHVDGTYRHDIGHEVYNSSGFTVTFAEKNDVYSQYMTCYASPSSRVNAGGGSNTHGMLLGTRYSGSNTLYKNGSQLGTSSQAGTSAPNNNLYILADSTSTKTKRELCFAGITEGLSSTDAENLYTHTQTLQTDLSRNV